MAYARPRSWGAQTPQVHHGALSVPAGLRADRSARRLSVHPAAWRRAGRLDGRLLLLAGNRGVQMNRYQITNQRDLRIAFWEQTAEGKRGAKNSRGEYPVDI